MKVEIKTPFCELGFDMSHAHALELIQKAVEIASKSEREKVTLAPEPVAPAAPAPVAPAPAPASTEKQDDTKENVVIPGKPARNSRISTMFGDRTQWSGQAASNTGKPAGDRGPIPEAEGYKGFLYVRCGACGEDRGFFAKFPHKFHKCKCGMSTDLKNLIPVHAVCKCGERIKYQTNIRDKCLSIDCLNCGAAMDMELNRKETAYVAVM